MDKFNPKCEGEYSKTILGKLGAWGDKVSSKGIGKKINDFIRWLNVKTYKMSKKAKLCILYATILQALNGVLQRFPEPV